MIDEGYRHSTPPIKLNKARHPAPDIPRDLFRYNFGPTEIIGLDTYTGECMRYVEAHGMSYAVSYHRCPYTCDLEDGNLIMIFDCSKAELITWVDIDVK